MRRSSEVLTEAEQAEIEAFLAGPPLVGGRLHAQTAQLTHEL